jgi:hypothetical protein
MSHCIFLPYTINLDPVWLLTNTNKALGRQHARTPMSEAILTGLLGRFITDEVSTRQGTVKAVTTYADAPPMLAGA